jgi:serine/threonine-protein kinase
MSPEAIRSPESLDGRSDLYALGAVGYFLLTGHHVFEGRTLVEVCGHHLHSAPEPPSKRLGGAVPEDLEVVLLACLEKDPARRPASAARLRQSLRSCQAFGEWDDEAARRWWSERALLLGERRGASPPAHRDDPSAAGPPSGSLLSVDMDSRGP